MDYLDVMSNISEQIKSVSKPTVKETAVELQPQKQDNNENLLNSIGLAINREGGMNI